ncbi:MAG: hypothetical protein KKF48_01255 [Nanoarchaeota archaeon]|nr:hypothetical protein [Nanoarchaeota archaeon]MBU1027650.1 hypothetical protein [Nanoarchaeota archaeon]
MKTIALKDRTFNLIKDLKEKHKMKSFDKLIIDLIVKEEKVPKIEEMFGILKGKTKGFTRKDREEIWGDPNRDF